MRKLIIIMVTVIVIFIGGMFIKNLFYENQISKLVAIRDEKQSIVDARIADVFHIDEQSTIDKSYMEKVFRTLFTFYNKDEFLKARQTALDLELPMNFVNRMYDVSELTYADTMLDVLCKYESSEFYLLKRDSDMSYYYATVKLSTVKYSNSYIEMSFFLTLTSTGNNRIKSIVYYNI